MEEVAVEGDGAAVTHVPDGGMEGSEGFEDEEGDDRERGQHAPDFEEKKNEAAVFFEGLLQQIGLGSAELVNALTISRCGYRENLIKPSGLRIRRQGLR